MTAKTATPMTDALKHTVRPDARLLTLARKLESDRARLMEALESLADSHEVLERERGSMRATHTANARSLLRELEEGK